MELMVTQAKLISMMIMNWAMNQYNNQSINQSFGADSRWFHTEHFQVLETGNVRPARADALSEWLSEIELKDWIHLRVRNDDGMEVFVVFRDDVIEEENVLARFHVASQAHDLYTREIWKKKRMRKFICPSKS